MITFRVGDQVVDVGKDSLSLCELLFRWVFPPPGGSTEPGKVYTISNIFVAQDGGLMLEFVGVCAPEDLRWEAGFDAHHYRPVRTTDISIFTAMLAPTPRVKQPV